MIITTSFIPHVEGIPTKIPTYNEYKEIKYMIIERDLSSEIGVKPAVEIENISATYNTIPPVMYDPILVENKIELQTRYSPTPNERKLMAALVWREDHTSVESMMAVAEVVLNRLESDVYCFSKLKSVEDVIFQAGWIKGCYVEQYIEAKSLYKIERSPKASRLDCYLTALRQVPLVFYRVSWQLREVLLQLPAPG